MAKFKINYRDEDPCCPIFNMTVDADDKEHAEIIFYADADGFSGWEIVSIKKVE